MVKGAYLAADIYNDKAFQDEFLYGSGDTHSLFAWMVFRKECEALGCTCVADIKTKAKQWRQAVKAIEFAYLFGAAAPTIAKSANCSEEQAQKYIDDLNEGFKGISTFAKKGLEVYKKEFIYNGSTAKLLCKTKDNFDIIVSINPNDFQEELGDVLYSLLSLAEESGVDAETALDRVLAKYKKRIESSDNMGSGR